MDFEIVPAYDNEQEIKVLFKEYTDYLIAGDEVFGEYLKIQHYEEELENLNIKYAPEFGRLYIAKKENEILGCIALKKIDDSCCEMKRLYVREEYRGNHIAQALILKIIDDARVIGYKKMLLDTLEFLHGAIKLYEKFGFARISRYNDSPMKNAVYMELKL